MSNRVAQPQQSDSTSPAWVLTLAEGLQAAVSEIEMLHLSADPELFEIPASPLHCRHVCIWNDELLPVMDILAWLTGKLLPLNHPLVGVVGYARGLGLAVDSMAVQLGGLLLPSLPKRVVVGEEQACGLPDDHLKWQEIAISCFADERGRAIPILDLPRIFSDALLPLDVNTDIANFGRQDTQSR